MSTGSLPATGRWDWALGRLGCLAWLSRAAPNHGWGARAGGASGLFFAKQPHSVGRRRLKRNPKRHTIPAGACSSAGPRPPGPFGPSLSGQPEARRIPAAASGTRARPQLKFRVLKFGTGKLGYLRPADCGCLIAKLPTEVPRTPSRDQTSEELETYELQLEE